MKTMRLDRLKELVSRHADRIVTDMRTSCQVEILNVRMYLQGETPTTHRRLRSKIADAVRKAVSQTDVRNLAELLRICPKGTVKSIPPWVYDSPVAELCDDGWVLHPSV